MPEQQPTLTRHDLESKIVKRCWEDEGFRKEFTADPKGTFVKYLNVPAATLPAITVHQEEPGSWHIVIPAKPSVNNELSDDELEKVAGGVTPVISISLASAASGVTSVVISAQLSIVEGEW